MCSCLGFKQGSYRKATGATPSSKQYRDLVRCCFATFPATRPPLLSAPPGCVSPASAAGRRMSPSLSHRLSVSGSSVSQEQGERGRKDNRSVISATPEKKKKKHWCLNKAECSASELQDKQLSFRSRCHRRGTTCRRQTDAAFLGLG